jgi:DnaJ-class molecular chaperone
LELGLEDDFDVKTLKLRYKALVKKWHPDTNGGSRDAEERLKSINAAYKTLQNAIKAYTATSTGKY